LTIEKKIFENSFKPKVKIIGKFGCTFDNVGNTLE